MATQVANLTAAARLALCAEIHQAPPPTAPVAGSCPAQCSAGATAIWPLGVLTRPWKTAPPYQSGPGSIKILLLCSFTNCGPNRLCVNIVLFPIAESSSLAIRTQFAPPVLTVIAFGPVTWLAGHSEPHM